jgi:hypothetical protein
MVSSWFGGGIWAGKLLDDVDTVGRMFSFETEDDDAAGRVGPAASWRNRQWNVD